jgi:hypothetical protein
MAKLEAKSAKEKSTYSVEALLNESGSVLRNIREGGLQQVSEIYAGGKCVLMCRDTTFSISFKI